MQVAESQGSNIFVIQTLYDGKWRCDRKFICVDQAQQYAALLIPDWGVQRVRLLLGIYDVGQDRRHYQKLVIEPPKSRYQRAKTNINAWFRQAFQPMRGRIAFGIVIAAVCVGLSFFAISALTSSPTLASSDKDRQNISPDNEAKAPIARSIQDIFTDFSSSKYAKSVTMEGVPIRLRGDWSRHCASGGQGLQLLEKTVTELDGAIATDRQLQIVFQAGQTYGLVTKDGKTRILELVSIDRVKIVGDLSEDGKFTAATEETPLHRCL